jgi:uncharacterized protein (TIGR00297 family)
MEPLLALSVATAIALGARLLRALSWSGAIAAIAVGTLILSNTGWAGCAVLGIFFAGSTLVSRIAASVRPPDHPADEVRDWIQVTANGGIAALGSFGEWIEPGLGLWLVTTTLAAAGADTWATAFGSLSPRTPRDILGKGPVAPGTSGGVTWFGTSGGVMGSALIALIGATSGGRLPLYGAAVAIGILGMVADSALGSALQARYRCPACGEETERRRHRCGTPTEPIRGFRWLDNHAVNAATTGLAGLAGLLAWQGLSR